MNGFDDILNGFMGSGRRTAYSEEEIEAALKRQKKNGGTFMDNLAESTGRRLQADYDLEAELSRLNQNLQKDFGDLTKKNEENAEAAAGEAGTDFLGRPYPAGQEETAVDLPEKEISAESFKGTFEAVSETVFGQEAFLKKLIVAFKRPFVLPEEENHARNCIFLTGPEDSGKHAALAAVVRNLAEKKILASPDVKTVDLSIYPSAGNDKVFLQDLYAALMAGTDVILFEHFEACHSSYLGYLSDLVMKGECRLSERYILQKGQLVNVNTSFASEAISTFSAKGKYLVFLSTKNVTKLADAFGAPFINALGDLCESAPLTAESYEKIAGVKWKEVLEKCEKRLSFRVTAEETDLVREAVKYTEKGAGTAGLLSFFDQLLKSLAALRLERELSSPCDITLKFTDGQLTAVLPEEEIALMDLLSAGYTGELEAVKKELDGIVGLTEIKEYILSLEEYYRVQKRRKEEGLKTAEVSRHMIFTGNPGTGKTTIARIISRYLKAIGVLAGGQLVEVTRADLVGRYVGHTAPLTNQVIQSALGGVLFIDEAYSLYRGNDDSFGLEAIDTLVKGIEDHRDDLIVILAGYEHEMETFLEANSGLKSRFPNFIHFPDYTGEELLQIAKITAAGKGYVIEEAAEQALLTYFNMMQAFHADTAGNGRLVRNKIEEAILNQSRRLAAEKDADLSLLLTMDFDLTDKE